MTEYDISCDLLDNCRRFKPSGANRKGITKGKQVPSPFDNQLPLT